MKTNQSGPGTGIGPGTGRRTGIGQDSHWLLSNQARARLRARARARARDKAKDWVKDRDSASHCKGQARPLVPKQPGQTSRGRSRARLRLGQKPETRRAQNQSQRPGPRLGQATRPGPSQATPRH